MRRLLALCLLLGCDFPGWEKELDGVGEAYNYTFEISAMPACEGEVDYVPYWRWHSGLNCGKCYGQEHPCLAFDKLTDQPPKACLPNSWACDGIIDKVEF